MNRNENQRSHYDTSYGFQTRSSPYLFPTVRLINVDRVVMDFIDSPTMSQKENIKNIQIIYYSTGMNAGK